MDVLIIIAALLIVGGILSAMHGFIKPAVDWLYPLSREPAEQPIAPKQPCSNCAKQVTTAKQSRSKRKAPDVGHAKWWANEARKRRIRKAVAAHKSARQSAPITRPHLP